MNKNTVNTFNRKQGKIVLCFMNLHLKIMYVSIDEFALNLHSLRYYNLLLEFYTLKTILYIYLYTSVLKSNKFIIKTL